MQMMASGHAEEVVARLSESAEAQETEARGSFELSFDADDLGLPDGGWVRLEIVGGGADYNKTAEASPDGKVRFTVPKQDKGSIITVTLTMYLPDGTPYCTGCRTGPAEGGAAFTIPLEDLPAVIITFGGNGAKNGKTAEQGGKSYEVTEYTGTSLSMAVASTIAEATLEVTVNGSPASTSGMLSDGFNEISVVATMSGGKPPVTATKRVYVVKKLSEDDISITFDDYLDSATDGDYQVLRYSYLADTITLPNVSVSNEYTGDATTPELGDSYLEITVTGDTSVAETDSLSSQDLNCGDSTVTVYLRKEKCTPVGPIEKKVRVKIKPVTVSMSSITLDYDTKDFHRWVTQSSYVQASNADGTDSTQKTVYAMNRVRYGADGWNPVKTVSVSAVLTAPDSSFRFWTTEGIFTYDDNPGETPTSVGSYDRPWTLDDLRDTANRSVDQKVGVSKAASRYKFTLNVTD